MHIDATIVISHSDKQQAAPTGETYGFHPLTVFADHGQAGPGSRWPSCCAPATPDPTQPPITSPPPGSPWPSCRAHQRRQVLIRADSGGGTHDFLASLSQPGQPLAYSVRFTMTDHVQDAIRKVPALACTPAYDSDSQVRDVAQVAELTGLLYLSGWPKGMRVIARKERPHPGAQLRFTDIGGHRFTCFATSTRTGQLAYL